MINEIEKGLTQESKCKFKISDGCGKRKKKFS
jgi:hypothetical protein